MNEVQYEVKSCSVTNLKDSIFAGHFTGKDESHRAADEGTRNRPRRDVSAIGSVPEKHFFGKYSVDLEFFVGF